MEVQEGEGICIPMADVWQKPMQHCKAIILQLKMKLKDYILKLGNLKIYLLKNYFYLRNWSTENVKA